MKADGAGKQSSFVPVFLQRQVKAEQLFCVSHRISLAKIVDSRIVEQLGSLSAPNELPFPSHQQNTSPACCQQKCPHTRTNNLKMPEKSVIATNDKKKHFLHSRTTPIEQNIQCMKLIFFLTGFSSLGWLCAIYAWASARCSAPRIRVKIYTSRLGTELRRDFPMGRTL